MTLETVELIRFYVEATRKVSKVAAHNCHANGYHSTARLHENEAAMADIILAELNELSGKD